MDPMCGTLKTTCIGEENMCFVKYQQTVHFFERKLEGASVILLKELKQVYVQKG
jgi:hypothetical protein